MSKLYPREIKEYYRDAYQQAKNQGDTSLSFSEFVSQQREKILAVVEEFRVESDTKDEIDWVGAVKKLRKDGKVAKFISLTTLQKIVQFSGKEGFELEDVFDFPANTITQDLQLQQTAVPRIDDLVQSQSDSKLAFAVEWISNAIDAVSPHKQIGRFGEGFFQSLQHLQDEDNEIQVTSKSQNDNAYRVSLKKRGDNLLVAPERYEKNEKGTSVVLKSELGTTKQKKLQEYISAKFRANTRAVITLNGEKINNFGKYHYINGQNAVDQESLPHISIEIDSGGIRVSDTGVGMDSQDLAGKLLYPNTTSKKREKVSDEEVKNLSPNETRFFFTHKQNKTDKTHISLQVAGVIIEDFHVASVGGIGECVFEFPSFSPLEDSRNEIKVSRETTISLTSALEKVAHKTQNLQDKLGLLEVIGSIYHHLKDRPTNIVDEDFTLETNMKKAFKGIREDIEATGVTILPAEEKIMNCFGTRDDIFYIDPDFIDFQVEKIPGISEISESVLRRSITKQGKEVRFFEVDFDAGATHDYVLGEEYVLVNRNIFADKTEQQRDMLIQVINIGVNLNTDYELDSERISYGRLPTSSEGKIVPKIPQQKTEILSLENIRSQNDKSGTSSGQEIDDQYDFSLEIQYIDQELEAFEEEYFSKFPESISDNWYEVIREQQRPHFRERETKKIQKVLREGGDIESVLKRLQVSMMLKISKVGIDSQQIDELYAILFDFLESKNSSLTSPTFEFLSSLAESMIFKDTTGFIRYTQTLLKALEQDPKNVVILMQEFTQKREELQDDPHVGHLERTRVERIDTSAFGVFRDIVNEKTRMCSTGTERRKRKSLKSNKYEFNPSHLLEIIGEGAFMGREDKETFEYALQRLTTISSQKFGELRSYMMKYSWKEIDIVSIQAILGGELGVVENNIRIFEILSIAFQEESKIEKEAAVDEYFFPVDWPLKVRSFCGKDRGSMTLIIEVLMRFKTSQELYDFRKKIDNSRDVGYLKLFLEELQHESGIPLTGAVDFEHFLSLFQIFFRNEELEPRYIPDMEKLDTIISRVFPESGEKPMEDILQLVNLVRYLDDIGTSVLYDFRKLLLERDDFSVIEAQNIIPGIYEMIPGERQIEILNMLKKVFEYELDEHMSQGEDEVHHEYTFPKGCVATFIEICSEEDWEKMSNIVRILMTHRNSKEIYLFKKDILECRRSSDIESFLKALEDDSGMDLISGIEINDFILYFDIFFTYGEQGPYETDLDFLSESIGEVFPDPTKESPHDIILLTTFIQRLTRIDSMKVDRFRRLLLHRDDYSIQEIIDVLQCDLFALTSDKNRSMRITNMLRKLFEYEVSQSKREEENTESEDNGTYQFPDDIMYIATKTTPDEWTFLLRYTQSIITALQKLEPSEIFNIRNKILRGSISDIEFKELVNEFGKKFSDPVLEILILSTCQKILQHLKEIFEYEITQKEWESYNEYSYLSREPDELSSLEGDDNTLLTHLLFLRNNKGDIEFMNKYISIWKKACLLGFIRSEENPENILGVTQDEVKDIKEDISGILEEFLWDINMLCTDFIPYLQGEFGDTNLWNGMVSKLDYSNTLIEMGYSPQKVEKMENSESRILNIKGIKLSEEFFMSLSEKYSPDIIAFAQFLESDGEYLSPRESKVDISESGVISTSLSQIIATSLRENSTLLEGINLQEFTELLGESGETMQQFNEIIAGVCLAQDEVSMYFLREGIQNARDALISIGKNDNPILVDAYDRDGKFTTSVSDSVGMELSDVITKLLTPYNSGKNGTGTTGKFGKGFFTFAASCSELRIKSSTGNGIVSYMKMIPQLQDGIITDFEVFIEEKQEDFTGTTIERVDELGGIQGNLRALIGNHLLKKYVGNTQDVDIDFAGTVINKPTGKTLVTESPSLRDADGTDIGTIKIYKTKDNTERFTKDNLWISEIKEDILSDFPDWIIDFVRKQKYSIDIPSGTPLVGSRNSLENREYYVNLFKPELYRMVIEIALREHVGGTLKIPMMPEDYLALLRYEHKTNDDITVITRKHNSGDELTSNDIESLKDTAHMAQFLTEVEFDFGGEKTSLRAIKKSLHDETMKRGKYGPRFQDKVEQAQEQKDGLNSMVEKFNLSYGEITELTGLSEYKIQKFKKFIQEGLGPVINERFTGGYNISFHTNPKGGEIANSYGGGGFGCSFRVDTPAFRVLVENISSPKTQERVIGIVAHEMTHNVEDTLGTRKWGTHETDELHDASFMRINREIITQLGRGVISTS